MSTWTWRQGPGEWSDRSGQGPSSQPQWQVQLYDKTQVLGAHLKSLKNHSSPTTAELQCMTDSGKASLGQACWHPVQEALLPEQPSGLSCPCGLLLHLGPPASPAAACVLSPGHSPACLHTALSLFWCNKASRYCWLHSIQLKCKLFSLFMK